jgi:hypothetical protein
LSRAALMAGAAQVRAACGTGSQRWLEAHAQDLHASRPQGEQKRRRALPGCWGHGGTRPALCPPSAPCWCTSACPAVLLCRRCVSEHRTHSDSAHSAHLLVACEIERAELATTQRPLR